MKTNVFYLLTAILLFNQWKMPTQTEPYLTQQIIATLQKERHAVKVEFDHPNLQVYWLNQTGEIYRMHTDGSQLQLINKGFGPDIGITFIEDFCLDVQHRQIYFVDLFDLQSGNSAIKRSDMEGNHIETLDTFEHSKPYQLNRRPLNAIAIAGH